MLHLFVAAARSAQRLWLEVQHFVTKLLPAVEGAIPALPAAAKAAGGGPVRGRGAAADLTLLDECWTCVFSFLSPEELCRCARLGPSLSTLAEGDDLWRALCRSRWAGKLYMPDDLFRNGDYSSVHLSVAECKSLLRRRGCRCAHLKERSELADALRGSNPRMRSRMALPRRGKWKISYACAEADSLRQDITDMEVSYFRWQLVYHGRASSMGLRHFRADHVFVSPHFGQTTWELDRDGNFHMRGVMPLSVQRDLRNWGWVIGKDSGTEYHAVEVDTSQ